jgi:limonene-1,2-epoxide hydrolase
LQGGKAVTLSTKPQAGTKRLATLQARDVRDFLVKYKKAWENRDADLAAGLFTRDARYKENPFAEPIVGREAIHDYWKAATERQEDIHFNVSSSFHVGYIVVAEWTCSYRDRASGARRELAGMFFADFYGKQVRAFREYWQSRSL